MSNEELALRIQAGETEYMVDLWEAVHPLLAKLVQPYLERAARMRYDMDDLLQEAYFALEGAVQAYDRDKGFAFNTYLNFQVAKVMRPLLKRWNGKDRYIFAASLDTPIGDDGDGATLQDVIPDQDCMLEATAVEHVQSSELMQTMEKRLTQQEYNILYYRYWQGFTLEAVGRSFDHQREWARSIEARAIRKLRRYRYEFSGEYCYRHKGLAAYKSSLSSVVEDIVMKREEILRGPKKGDEP